MKTQSVTRIVSMVFLIGMLTLTFNINIQPAKSVGRVAIIHEDGSISPLDAPIVKGARSVYLLTEDCDAWQIQIERNHTALDGQGHLLRGTSPDLLWGIKVTGRHSVTIRNMVITEWTDFGIFLNETSGINLCELEMSNNYVAIGLGFSTVNTISDNNIFDNIFGILLHHSDYNNFVRNYITNNWYGMAFKGSCFNEIYCNTFDNTDSQVVYDITVWSENRWDNGYRYGGNYWSDYEERYPDAKELNDSGIWNTPYVVQWDDKDYYPLIETHNVRRPPPRSRMIEGGGEGMQRYRRC